MDIADFKSCTSKYDLMIMFHIIEHFSLYQLLQFMVYYFDRLKSGGYLNIATHILTKLFYQDFDNIRLHDTLCIEMVFGKNEAQVQYSSKIN